MERYDVMRDLLSFGLAVERAAPNSKQTSYAQDSSRMLEMLQNDVTSEIPEM
jgi:hypothetical protein